MDHHSQKTLIIHPHNHGSKTTRILTIDHHSQTTFNYSSTQNRFKKKKKEFSPSSLTNNFDYSSTQNCSQKQKNSHHHHLATLVIHPFNSPSPRPPQPPLLP